MDPIALITMALVCGATEMAKGALAEPGRELYQGLKERIVHLFAGNSKAEETLKDHQADSDTYEKPLKKVLEQTQVDKDAEVLRMAQDLLKALDPAGSAKGRYTVTASGERAVAIGGSVSNGTIITGDYPKPQS